MASTTMSLSNPGLGNILAILTVLLILVEVASYFALHCAITFEKHLEQFFDPFPRSGSIINRFHIQL
jgi:hypothetical protein